MGERRICSHPLCFAQRCPRARREHMSENWLILETSGRGARIGLARDRELRRRAELDAARRHTREMIPTVDAMLNAESLRPRDLTGVIVSRGPGSYTGL